MGCSDEWECMRLYADPREVDVKMEDSRQSTHKQRNLQALPTKSRRASRKLYNQ